MDIILIGLILVVILGIIILVVARRRQPKLSKKIYKLYASKLQATASLDPSHSVLENHKIFIKALKSLLSDSSLRAVDCVKQFQSRFTAPKSVWRFHRLRNQVAHETDVQVSKKIANEARSVFLQALKDLT
jgi:hypothetical protein